MPGQDYTEDGGKRPHLNCEHDIRTCGESGLKVWIARYGTRLWFRSR